MEYLIFDLIKTFLKDYIQIESFNNFGISITSNCISFKKISIVKPFNGSVENIFIDISELKSKNISVKIDYIELNFNFNNNFTPSTTKKLFNFSEFQQILLHNSTFFIKNVKINYNSSTSFLIKNLIITKEKISFEACITIGNIPINLLNIEILHKDYIFTQFFIESLEVNIDLRFLLIFLKKLSKIKSFNDFVNFNNTDFTNENSEKIFIKNIIIDSFYNFSCKKIFYNKSFIQNLVFSNFEFQIDKCFINFNDLLVCNKLKFDNSISDNSSKKLSVNIKSVEIEGHDNNLLFKNIHFSPNNGSITKIFYKNLQSNSEFVFDNVIFGVLFQTYFDKYINEFENYNVLKFTSGIISEVNFKKVTCNINSSIDFLIESITNEIKENLKNEKSLKISSFTDFNFEEIFVNYYDIFNFKFYDVKYILFSSFNQNFTDLHIFNFDILLESNISISNKNVPFNDYFKGVFRKITDDKKFFSFDTIEILIDKYQDITPLIHFYKTFLVNSSNTISFKKLFLEIDFLKIIFKDNNLEIILEKINLEDKLLKIDKIFLIYAKNKILSIKNITYDLSLQKINIKKFISNIELINLNKFLYDICIVCQTVSKSLKENFDKIPNHEHKNLEILIDYISLKIFYLEHKVFHNIISENNIICGNYLFFEKIKYNFDHNNENKTILDIPKISIILKENDVYLRISPIKLYLSYIFLRSIKKIFKIIEFKICDIFSKCFNKNEDKPYIFNIIDINKIFLTVTYAPDYIKFAKVWSGNYTELLKGITIKNSNIVLEDIRLTNIVSCKEFIERILELWISNWFTNFVNIIRSIPVVTPIANITENAYQLINLPIKNYSKGKFIFNGSPLQLIKLIKCIIRESIGHFIKND